MTRIIFRTEEEALAAVKATGKEYFSSSADDRSHLENDDNFNLCWSGEVAAYRTDDGDIFAWWE